MCLVRMSQSLISVKAGEGGRGQAMFCFVGCAQQGGAGGGMGFAFQKVAVVMMETVPVCLWTLD